MTDLTQLERIARAFERRDRDWYVLGPPWVGFTSDFTILQGHPDPHVGEAILYTVPIEEADEDEDHYRQEALAKWLELADPQTVLDLIERVRAAEGKLEEIRQIEKAPDDEHDEYGFNSCHIEGYNSGLEICQEIARRAAALHTDGGGSDG